MATADALRLELAEGATAPFNKRSFAQFGLEMDDAEAALSSASASSAGESSSGAASSSQTSAASSSSSGMPPAATSGSGGSGAAGPSEPKRARANPDTAAARGALRIDASGAASSSSSAAAARSRSRPHSSPSSASPSPSHSVGPSAASGLIASSSFSASASASAAALVPPGRRRVRRTHRSTASTTPTMSRPTLELSLPEIPSLASLEPLIAHPHPAPAPAPQDAALLRPGQLWVADALTASPSHTPTPAAMAGDPLIEIPSSADPMQVDSDGQMDVPAASNSLNLALGFAERSELDLHLPALDAIVRTRDHWHNHHHHHHHHQHDISSSSSSSPSMASATHPATPPVLSLNINISTDSLFSDLAVDQQPQTRSQPPPPPRFDASYRLRQRPHELSDDLPLPSPPLRPVVPARPPRSELVRSGFWSSGVRERRQPQQPPPPVPALPIMAAPLQMPDAEISQPQPPQEAHEEELEEPLPLPRSRDRLHLVQSGFWSSGRRERRERDRLRDPAQPPPVPPLPGALTQAPDLSAEEELAPVAGSSSAAAAAAEAEQQQHHNDAGSAAESDAAIARRERLHRQRSGFWSSGYRERRQPRNVPPVPPMPDPPVLPPPIITTREPLLPPLASSSSLRDSFPMSSATSTRDSLPADFRQRVVSPGLHTASTTGTWDPLASPLRPTPTLHTPPRLDFDISPSFMPLRRERERVRDSMPPSLPMPLELPMSTSIELPPMIPPPDFLTSLSTELDGDPLEVEREHEHDRAPGPERMPPVPPSLPPLELGDLAMEASAVPGPSTAGARNRASDPGAATRPHSTLPSPTSPLRSSRYSHNLGLLDLSLDEPWNGIANSLRLPAEPVLQPLTVSSSPRSSMSLSSESSPTGARHSLQRASTFAVQRNSLGEGPSGTRHSTSSFHTARLSLASNAARHSSGSMFSGHSHTRPPMPSRPSSSGNGASSPTTTSLRRSSSGRPMGPRDAAPSSTTSFPWYSGSGSAGPSRFATPLSLSRASPAPPTVTSSTQLPWVPAYNPDEDDSHSGSDSDVLHRPHATNARRRRMGTRSPTPMEVDNSPGPSHLTLAPMVAPTPRTPSPHRLLLPLAAPTTRPRLFGEGASASSRPRPEASRAELPLHAHGHASSSRYTGAAAAAASTSRRGPSPVRTARPPPLSSQLRTAFHPVRPAAPTHTRSFSASSSSNNNNNDEGSSSTAAATTLWLAPTRTRTIAPPSSFHPHPVPERQRTLSSSRAHAPAAPTLPQLDFSRLEGSSSSSHRHSMHAASTPSVQQTHISPAPAQPTPPIVSRGRRVVFRRPSEDSISEDQSDAPNPLHRLLHDMSSPGASGSGASTTERMGEFALGRPTALQLLPRRARRRDAVDDTGLASPTAVAGTSATGGGPATPGASGRLWGVPRMNRGDYIDDATWDPSYENLMRLAARLGEAKPKGVPANIIDNLPSGLYRDFAEAEGDTRCPICLEDYLQADEVMRLTECPHWMHKGCLEQWLHNARSCPVCRMRVNVVRYSCGSTSATESVAEAGPSRLAQRRAMTSRFIQESRNINVRMMHADVHGWPSME